MGGRELAPSVRAPADSVLEGWVGGWAPVNQAGEHTSSGARLKWEPPGDLALSPLVYSHVTPAAPKLHRARPSAGKPTPKRTRCRVNSTPSTNKCNALSLRVYALTPLSSTCFQQWNLIHRPCVHKTRAYRSMRSMRKLIKPCIYFKNKIMPITRFSNNILEITF